MESLNQAYIDIAKQLHLPGCEADKTDAKKLVQDHLSKKIAGQWLLVFDNADDITMWTKPGSEAGSSRLVEYLPRSQQGCIVFTSRDRKTAVKLAHNDIVEVPQLDEDTARQLMQKSLINPTLIDNGTNTKALLEELTYLPLAIVQAMAYINENGINFAEYQSLLTDQEEDIIDLLSEDFEDDGRYYNIKNPVATTWLISFEQIQNRDPLAAEYLSFMACIDPKDIPQALLPPSTSQKKVLEAIGTLEAYSFIVKRPLDLALHLHRLVHLATRNWLRKEKLITHWMKRAIKRLEEVFPDNEHENRNIWRMYLPHVKYALISDTDDEDSARTKLAWRFGLCLFNDGRYSEAEAQFKEASSRENRAFGLEHPSTLTSMANLASTYWNQGRWKEAEELEVQVMETEKRVLGLEHPDTLISMGNLASTYRNQGRWKEAEELEVQVMETEKIVLGLEHPDTLISMGNLASTYRIQGRLKEAEELDVQVMETWKRVLGPEHPSTLTSMNNLAFTLKGQGKNEIAFTLMEECLRYRIRLLGTDHPDTKSSLEAFNQWRVDSS